MNGVALTLIPRTRFAPRSGFADRVMDRGPGVECVLFPCGYFDSGYLGGKAAEGIDWVGEHRNDDFQELAL